MSLILQNFDKYVYRGECFEPDWTNEDFIKDEDWHELDLSSVIPIGTKVVHFRGLFKNTAADMQIVFKTGGHTGNFDGVDIFAPPDGVHFPLPFLIVPSADRKIEYWIQTYTGTWAQIALTIAGWII